MRIHAEEIQATSLDAVREKDPAQLKQDLKTLRDTSVDLRFQKAFAQLENSAKPHANKKNIARVLTVLREKQIQQFLLNDAEVGELLASGKISLSAGKNDPAKPISRADIAGTDHRAITLAQRLWAKLRKNRDFWERTNQIPRI